MNNETVTINPKNLEILVNTNGALTRQLEAQRKRIEFLEMVLAQHFSLTVRTWDPAKTDEMKRYENSQRCNERYRHMHRGPELISNAKG